MVCIHTIVTIHTGGGDGFYAKSAPKALEWASSLFGGNLLPKKGEPGYAKIVQKFRDVRKLYDDDSD